MSTLRVYCVLGLVADALVLVGFPDLWPTCGIFALALLMLIFSPH